MKTYLVNATGLLVIARAMVDESRQIYRDCSIATSQHGGDTDVQVELALVQSGAKIIVQRLKLAETAGKELAEMVVEALALQLLKTPYTASAVVDGLKTGYAGVEQKTQEVGALLAQMQQSHATIVALTAMP